MSLSSVPIAASSKCSARSPPFSLSQNFDIQLIIVIPPYHHRADDAPSMIALGGGSVLGLAHLVHPS